MCSLVIHISSLEQSQLLCSFLSWTVSRCLRQSISLTFNSVSSWILTLWFTFLVLLHGIKLVAPCWDSDGVWAHLLYLWISYCLMWMECLCPLRIRMLQPQTSLWQCWQALRFRTGHWAGGVWWEQHLYNRKETCSPLSPRSGDTGIRTLSAAQEEAPARMGIIGNPDLELPASRNVREKTPAVCISPSVRGICYGRMPRQEHYLYMKEVVFLS